MLFSDFARTDDTPKRAKETDFAFLDRCAWESVGRVRALVERCLLAYPAEHALELVARLRSDVKANFRSAAFELLLHHYLLSLGLSASPHPKMSNGVTTRPDFLVSSQQGEEFYVEAVCATDDDGRDAPSADARKAVALDHLDAAVHPDFMVHISDEGSPTTQPSGRRLAKEVLAWLNTLNADQLIAAGAGHGLDALPQLEWKHEGWTLRVKPIPVDPSRRGKQTRLLGIRNRGAAWADGWTPIRDAVRSKGRHYGTDLDRPLIVAVNVDTFKLDPIDEVQALFGQEQFVFSREDPRAEPRFERAPNGAWRGPEGARGKRTSAAWLFGNLTFYSAAQGGHTLYLNPWADLQLGDSLLVVPYARVSNGHVQKFDGLSLGQALGKVCKTPGQICLPGQS